MKRKISLIFIGYALRILCDWNTKEQVEKLIEEIKKIEPSELNN